MNKKRILLISLIAVAVIASVSAVSAGVLEDLFGGGQQDNVIEVGGISFNTTNATDFKINKTFSDESSNEVGKTLGYRSENGTGDSFVVVMDYSGYYEGDDTLDQQMGDVMKDIVKDTPYQTVNGVVVYSSTKVAGNDVGKPVHMAYVQNSDLHKMVMLASPDQNETAKMVLSLKFK